MGGQSQYGPTRNATSDATPSIWSDITIQFECAAKLGRRKADPCGHLVFTREGLEFHGAREVNIVWRHVTGVDRV